MNIFQTIRELFGLTYQPADPEQDRLNELRLQRAILAQELEKAQGEFAEVDLELSLKTQAAELLLVKGGETAAANWRAIVDRHDRAARTFATEQATRRTDLAVLRGQVDDLEAPVLRKAVELVALLPVEEQAVVKRALGEWKQTGQVAGEPVEHQVDAITRVLGELVKGGEGSKGGKVIGHTKSGKPIYSKFEHKGHKDFTTEDHEDAKQVGREHAAKQSDPVRHSNVAQNAQKHANAAMNQRRDAAQKEREAQPGYAEKRARLKEVHDKMEAIPKYGNMGLPSKGKDTETWTKLHQEYTKLHQEINKADGDQPLTGDQVEFLNKADDGQKKKVKKVMDEWKAGKLKSSTGDPVTDQKQAIAIALSEAGLSKADDVEFEKAGEGSRGGKVIAHTKSGKPVYAVEEHESYHDFTPDEHFEAYGHHRAQAAYYGYNSTKGAQKTKERMRDLHHAAASEHLRASARRFEIGTDDKGRKVLGTYHPDHFDQLWVGQNTQAVLDQMATKSGAYQAEHDRLDQMVRDTPDDPANANRQKDIAILRSKIAALPAETHAQITTLKKPSEHMDLHQLQHHMDHFSKGGYAVPIPTAGGSGSAVRYNSPVAGHYANALVRHTTEVDGKRVEKILFLQRGADQPEAGKYCLPGGHIEEGETIEDAAARELFEEAHLNGTCYVMGKAKCQDGKWAFYCETYVPTDALGQLALLDGESRNACWLSREEWLAADLFYDLKDHLVALTTTDRRLEDVRDVMKPLKKAEDEYLILEVPDDLDDDSKKKS